MMFWYLDQMKMWVTIQIDSEELPEASTAKFDGEGKQITVR